MITLATFSVEEILPLIGTFPNKKIIKTSTGEYKVNTSSDRLLCFKANLNCTTCSAYGNIFKLETHTGEAPHFNLYYIGSDNKQVLMTKDHIIPRSKGGVDNLSNLQTMCEICNFNKSNLMPEEFNHILNHESI